MCGKHKWEENVAYLRKRKTKSGMFKRLYTVAVCCCIVVPPAGRLAPSTWRDRPFGTISVFFSFFYLLGFFLSFLAHSSFLPFPTSPPPFSYHCAAQGCVLIVSICTVLMQITTGRAQETCSCLCGRGLRPNYFHRPEARERVACSREL